MPLEGTVTLGVQKYRVVANPITLSGSPASIDGALQGEVLQGDVTVEPGNGPNDLVIRPNSGAALGDALVRVFGDADLGAGVELIEDLVTVHLVAERAANLGLTGGAEPL
jgi:hypothetical protein